MIPWENRPIEVANLLNPAFCGEIIRRAVKAYESIKPLGFPYPLVFLLLPVVLHRNTRETILPRQRSQFHVWIQNNQHVKIGFAERAKQLVPVTKEAITFLLQLKAVSIDDEANIKASNYHSKNRLSSASSEILDCYKKAEIVGRWFAKTGTTTNVYIMWGVKP
jgi:hypothetical protein